MEIVIDMKTPSVNHLYGHNRFGSTYLKNEAKAMRKSIEESIHKQVNDYEEYKDVPLLVVIDIHENWLTKKGEMKRKDIANREKFLIDSVFLALGLDDRFIVSSRYNKIQDIKEEKSVIKIEIVKFEDVNEKH